MSAFEILSLIIGGLAVLLTGVYVLLTLRIANKTADSVKATQASLALAREQLELNKQQSQEASAASERHSQATIVAVQMQIDASERQSNDAIATVREQIEESKHQALETIYNQHRPVLVCPYHPMAETSLKNMPLPIKNVGLDIALNIRGILSYRSSIKGEKLQLGFIIPSVIIPGDMEMVSFDMSGMYSVQDNIGEYSFFSEENDTFYKQRLIITVKYG